MIEAKVKPKAECLILSPSINTVAHGLKQIVDVLNYRFCANLAAVFDNMIVILKCLGNNSAKSSGET